MKNIRSSYPIYKSNSENPSDINEFARVNNDFNKFIMANILIGKEIKLPCKMGVVFVKGKKVKIKFDEDGNLKGFAPNYKATRELWEKCPECAEKKQLVFHLNEHTNNVRYKFFWSRDRMLVENKSFYTMIFTRTNKRVLADLINNGKEYFVELNNY